MYNNTFKSDSKLLECFLEFLLRIQHVSTLLLSIHQVLNHHFLKWAPITRNVKLGLYPYLSVITKWRFPLKKDTHS